MGTARSGSISTGTLPASEEDDDPLRVPLETDRCYMFFAAASEGLERVQLSLETPQGEEFRPPPDWASRHGGGGFEQGSFEDVDFADLFSRFGARGARGGAMPGQDFEVPVEISIEDAFHGTTLSLSLSMPEYDASALRLR